ncbi:hypothetical protein Tco_1173270 [Tanacetum coccineum]
MTSPPCNATDDSPLFPCVWLPLAPGVIFIVVLKGAPKDIAHNSVEQYQKRVIGRVPGLDTQINDTLSASSDTTWRSVSMKPDQHCIKMCHRLWVVTQSVESSRSKYTSSDEWWITKSSVLSMYKQVESEAEREVSSYIHQRYLVIRPALRDISVCAFCESGQGTIVVSLIKYLLRKVPGGYDLQLDFDKLHEYKSLYELGGSEKQRLHLRTVASSHKRRFLCTFVVDSRRGAANLVLGSVLGVLASHTVIERESNEELDGSVHDWGWAHREYLGLMRVVDSSGFSRLLEWAVVGGVRKRTGGWSVSHRCIFEGSCTESDASGSGESCRAGEVEDRLS